MKTLKLGRTMGGPAAGAGLRFFAAALAVLAAAMGAAGQQTAPQQANASLAGIAHVAIRVADLERSRDFYRRLGFEEAFAMKAGGSPSEAFFKINDRQFIELYPRHGDSQAVGFMHVCFEAADINAVYRYYVDHGLTPTPVKRAGAGNLLFTLQGPEEPAPVAGLRPAATQNIEYTQYMPGSRHTLDRGRHLGPGRLAERIAGAGIPVADVGAATAFYTEKLGFQQAADPLERGIAALALPGTPDQRIELLPDSGPSANDAGAALPFRIVFSVPDLKRAAAKLRALGIRANRHRSALAIKDPDGNEIVLIVGSRAAQDARF